MKCYFLTQLLLLTTLGVFSQNVGIGTPSPTEKLDINGNVNIAGAIKANGTAGQPNQVLTTNGSGNIAWGDISEYKNHLSFMFTTSNATQNWQVPAGITKIKVQLWGGGGNSYNGIPGISGGGGGGGGYVEGYLTVTPGNNVGIIVGSGANQIINTAQASSATYGSQYLAANPGQNTTYSSGNVYLGSGGTFFVLNTTSYIAMQGEGGMPDIVRFDQISSTNYARSIHYGDGGNAANTFNTGGKGGYYLFDVTSSTVLSNTPGGTGSFPGGGASNRNASGDGGGNGLVLIHY